jgi:hypothetical protein
MLTVFGRRSDRYCDGFSRRNFLQISALGCGGMLSPNLPHADASTQQDRHKSLIHVFLGGGPSQSEIFPNIEGPERFRTSFSPIATQLVGLSLCEHMPKLAAIADKLVFLPGVHAMDGSHQPHCCFSGAVMSGPGATREKQTFGPIGGRPSQGSYIARVLGSSDGSTPPYMSLFNRKIPGSGPGYLGGAYAPFSPNGQAAADMRLNDITLDRLDDRRRLLKSLDQLERATGELTELNATGAIRDNALQMIGAGPLADALDLSKEDPRVVDRYRVPGWNWKGGRTFDAGVTLGFVRARRLVEAGARYVAVGYGGWDTHQANDEILAGKLPILDHGLAALVTDLEQRGMLDDVTVLVWGEMGRGKPYDQPRKDPATGITGCGTGHHGDCAPAFLAGGGMRVGQVLGRLNRHGIDNIGRRVHNHEVLATVYHNLGIDLETARVTDFAGRPRRLLDHKPLHELT